ncbi:phosphate ABC transporter substrate-binding protein PstS [Nitrosarchaeum sp. AC2]|uniref:phosphate ABC transporter substrate-binding protein PstS n=1 Tax=Nitrosarchaeum sp. AC2 TaxID=2259673 RepID=UPI0015CC9E7B|nr:phosphate ABC transporter substrate-binding protein PstS [Nitrosarchaeum sp. AC2]QLH10509.1 phosphate ABC transporter substrate-binding protein PstS [Nitrosarchaeum sp. AC2]
MITKITSLLMIATIVAIVAPLDANAMSGPSPPDSKYVYNINGAGATFPFPLIDLWRVEYNNDFSNVNLNYQSIGSGGGVKQHIEKTVNFAASDAPLTVKEQGLAPGTIHIPETIGGVTVAYNIPEIPKSGLKLTGKVISGIFMGDITKWNDPLIKELNPELNLPNQDIVVAHRSDGSGTTFVFTDYLSTVDPNGWGEKVGKGKSVPWPTGLAAAGNEGVAGIIKSTKYSVGYVELAYVFQTGMTFAHVQNGDKSKFVEPSIATITAATAGIAKKLPAGDADWSAVSTVNAPGSDAYPISSFTYLLVYKDLHETSKSKEEAKAMLHMIYWMITDGQKLAPTLLYSPLPENVVELGKQSLSKVTYNGEVLWKYNSPVKTTETKNSAIPDWIRNNAKWWADGMITDEDYIKGLQYLIKEGILKV